MWNNGAPPTHPTDQFCAGLYTLEAQGVCVGTMMQSAGMELVERQADFESQAGQVDMLQALRSASLPDEFWMYSYK